MRHTFLFTPGQPEAKTNKLSQGFFWRERTDSWIDRQSGGGFPFPHSGGKLKIKRWQKYSRGQSGGIRKQCLTRQADRWWLEWGPKSNKSQMKRWHAPHSIPDSVSQE